MADTDLLPSRGVTFEALVDSTGVAINGSSTVAQLASKGMRAACAVDGTGTAITGGASLAQLAAAGIRAFCAVDQNGVAQDASTADQLRSRGIRPRVLLDATGVALNGSASQAVLASRGLTSFCPVDESGNATTMGAVILISNTNVFDNIAVGATVGTLSVAGGSGTYTFTLPSNPGAHFATAGTNGVNLNTATALTAGSYPVTVQAAGGVPTPVSRALSITVAQSPTIPVNTTLPVISGSTSVGSTLTTTDGKWTGFPAPTFTYQWKSGAANVGTNANTYTTVSGDAGNMITCVVTGTNVAGNANATSNALGPITASGATLGIPNLTWESTPDINPPVLFIGLPAGTLAGDHVVIQKSTDDVTWSAYADIVVVDPAAGSASGTAAALPTGAYILRPRMERGAAFSAWGTEININLIADVTAPTVVSYSPPDNSTSAAVNVELIATFSENILLGASGTISLKRTSDNSTIYSWNVATNIGSGAGQVEVLNYNELHLHLSADLTAGTEYYVVWTVGVVRDGAGNGVAAQSSTTAWSFTPAVAFTWTPVNASTPALWWVDVSNASTVTKTGTAPNEIVTQLNDLSGNARNMTVGTAGGPVYAASALNGLPGIVLAANGSLKTGSFFQAAPFMFVMVWRQTSVLGDAYGVMLDASGGTGDTSALAAFNRYNNINYSVLGNSLMIDQGVAVTTNTAYKSIIIPDGSNSSSVLNGSTVTGDLGISRIINGILLGYPAAGNQPNVTLHEAFVIPYADHAAVLANAPTDTANVNAYILAKWGIS